MAESWLNKDLKSFEWGAIPFGGSNKSAGEYTWNGGIYRIRDTGHGTRVVEYAGSESARAMENAQKQAAAEAAKLKSDRAAFDTRTKKEGEQFVNTFKTQYPTILSNIESELNLPQLRSATQAGFQNLEQLPDTVTQAAQGKDINANQLARMISSRQQELYPELQGMLSNQQFAEEEFGRRAERELTPFETEFQVLADRWAREATGFNMDAESRLNMILSQLNAGVQLTLGEMQQATALAELESRKEQLQMQISAGAYGRDEGFSPFAIDLGNRIGVYGQSGLLDEFTKGLAPSRGNVSADDGW